MSDNPFVPDKFGMSDTKLHALAANAFTIHHFLMGSRGRKMYVSPVVKAKKKREKAARKNFYRALRSGKMQRQ